VPGQPSIIKDRVMQAAGWQAHASARIFNLNAPPTLVAGDATLAGPWLDHLMRVYPVDSDYIADWFAHTVQAVEAPERGEMRDLLEELRSPAAFTVADLVSSAMRHDMRELENELAHCKNRRSIPHRMERAVCPPLRNPNADDGLFKVAGKRVVIYALGSLTAVEQIRAAQKRAASGSVL
jgi:hypothetical protein